MYQLKEIEKQKVQWISRKFYSQAFFPDPHLLVEQIVFKFEKVPQVSQALDKKLKARNFGEKEKKTD